jgi:hypothetical protein
LANSKEETEVGCVKPRQYIVTQNVINCISIIKVIIILYTYKISSTEYNLERYMWEYRREV